MYSNLSLISRYLNVNMEQLLLLTKGEIKRKFKDLVRYNETWKINMIVELLNCKQDLLFNNLERNEIEYSLDWLCTS